MSNYSSSDPVIWTKETVKSSAVCPIAKKYCTHLCALAVINPHVEDEMIWYCGLLGNNPHKIIEYIR